MSKIQQATFVSPSRFAVEKNKKKKKMATAKLSALHADAIIISTRCLIFLKDYLLYFSNSFNVAIAKTSPM